jgi:hypothetical protein
MLTRVFASSARCCSLDSLPAHRTNVLIVSLRISATRFSKFDRRASDVPCGVSLAIVLFAVLVFVGYQHGCFSLRHATKPVGFAEWLM